MNSATRPDGSGFSVDGLYLSPPVPPRRFKGFGKIVSIGQSPQDQLGHSIESVFKDRLVVVMSDVTIVMTRVCEDEVPRQSQAVGNP
jgi:hypothetical protein